MRHRTHDWMRFLYEHPEAGAGHPGVTQADEAAEHDLATDEGFTRRLAEKVGKEIPEGTVFPPSTSISEGLTFGDEQQPRDPATGKFLPRQPFDQEAPEAPEAPAAPAAPEAPAATEAPAQPLEERFAALEKQFQDAQSFIGRQAEEIGQLRQAAQQPQQAPAPLPVPMVDQQTAEAAFNMVENSGFQASMMWALNNRPDLHDVILQAGRDLDLPEARQYEINLAVQEALMAREAAAPQQPGVDPFVQNLKTQDTMRTVVAKIKGDTPDFVQLQPHVQKALEEQSLLAELVGSGDPDRVEQGLRLATGVARGYAASELATAAAQQASAGAAQREAAKVAAGVATGSARVGTGGETSEAPTEEQRAEAVKAFKAAIMEAPGTSIADGLTFG